MGAVDQREFTHSKDIRHAFATEIRLSLGFGCRMRNPENTLTLPTQAPAAKITIAAALLSLVLRPYELIIKRFNWKSAVCSSLIRGIIFFFANIKSGWQAASGAMLAEWTYRAFTSGFYGAMTQTIGEAEPEWQATLAAMVVLPLTSHILEFVVHYFRHTPHLKLSIISSMIFTVFSTLFNVYAMRRGKLVVGSNAASLGADLKAMPRMIYEFLAVVPLWIRRSLKSA